MSKIDEIGDKLSIPSKFINTVEEINLKLSDTVDDNNQLQNIYVLGEISNLNETSQGHIFFDLKYEDALISCIIFEYKSNKIGSKFEEGEEVVIQGSIDYYEKKGDITLKTNNIFPVGMGKYYKQRKELKEKLRKEGLFKKTHKKSIPKIPETIGIITSKEGDAIKDIVNSIRKRYPDMNIIVKHSAVQGEKAEKQIIEGINYLNSQKEIDVIIVGRGGGSIEDLQAFNKEKVAKAIFNSNTPIITGIGHREDETVSDYVADNQCITPTEAGKEAVPKKQELIDELNQLKNELNTAHKKFKKIKKREKQMKTNKKKLRILKTLTIIMITTILILLWMIT